MEKVIKKTVEELVREYTNDIDLTICTLADNEGVDVEFIRNDILKNEEEQASGKKSWSDYMMKFDFFADCIEELFEYDDILNQLNFDEEDRKEIIHKASLHILEKIIEEIKKGGH